MNDQPIDNNLTKYLLALMDIIEDTSLYSSHLADNPDHELLTSLNPQDLKAAYNISRFMDEMPGGFLIYHVDQKETIIYANHALLRIFRCDTLQEFQELTGNSFQGMVYEKDLEDVEQSIREQIQNSQYNLDHVEYRIVRKDGSIGWVEDYGHFVHSKSLGNIFYVFISDTTEKKNRQLTEQATFTQEYLQRMEIIEGLSVNYESILYADLDDDSILPYRVSSRTLHQFGTELKPRVLSWYLNDYINTWVHPSDRTLVLESTSPAYIRERLAHHKTYYINYRAIKDETIQYLQLRIVNVGKNEHVSQIVLGYRRVDEEIQREMDQKQLLKDALDKARLAIVAKNTFLSNMSHDMRTPLNAILGFTALAKKHLEDHKERMLCGDLDKIETSGRQLLELIEKTLEIAWLESNDTRIEETECNLADILQEVHQTLSAKAREKELTFSLNTSGLEHFNIYSDHKKLRQLFLYLVGNAVTYTNQNGRVSIIATELEKLPNDYAVYQFAIEDTGIGISKDALERIFEPFEREQNTTFSGIHGTGLGLTIAKNIIEMMGGHIEVESTVGTGSTFTVTLRFRRQNRPLPGNGSTEDILAHLKGRRILLVEDNEINLEIETELLAGLGFDIETAEDGSIAVEMVKSSAPGYYDLILMDIQMPVMNGRQATKAIRRLENTSLSRIPIVALSANAFESDRQKSIESGMDAHLTKPIDLPLLLETMAKTM